MNSLFIPGRYSALPWSRELQVIATGMEWGSMTKLSTELVEYSNKVNYAKLKYLLLFK